LLYIRTGEILFYAFFHLRPVMIFLLLIFFALYYLRASIILLSMLSRIRASKVLFPVSL